MKYFRNIFVEQTFGEKFWKIRRQLVQRTAKAKEKDLSEVREAAMLLRLKKAQEEKDRIFEAKLRIATQGLELLQKDNSDREQTSTHPAAATAETHKRSDDSKRSEGHQKFLTRNHTVTGAVLSQMSKQWRAQDQPSRISPLSPTASSYSFKQTLPSPSQSFVVKGAKDTVTPLNSMNAPMRRQDKSVSTPTSSSSSYKQIPVVSQGNSKEQSPTSQQTKEQFSVTKITHGTMPWNEEMKGKDKPKVLLSRTRSMTTSGSHNHRQIIPVGHSVDKSPDLHGTKEQYSVTKVMHGELPRTYSAINTRKKQIRCRAVQELRPDWVTKRETRAATSSAILSRDNYVSRGNIQL